MIGFLEKVVWVITILVIVGNIALVVAWKRGAPSKPQEITKKKAVMMTREDLAKLNGDEGKVFKADKSDSRKKTGDISLSKGDTRISRRHGAEVKVTPYEVEETQVSKYRSNFNDLYDEVSRSDAIFVQNYKGSPAVKVTKVAKNTIVDKIGLQVGDVVMSVNDRQIGGQKEAMALYEELKSKKSFTVEIERNGRIEIHHYTIK